MPYKDIKELNTNRFLCGALTKLKDISYQGLADWTDALYEEAEKQGYNPDQVLDKISNAYPDLLLLHELEHCPGGKEYRPGYGYETKCTEGMPGLLEMIRIANKCALERK